MLVPTDPLPACEPVPVHHKRTDVMFSLQK
jgi:hypothetical protein